MNRCFICDGDKSVKYHIEDFHFCNKPECFLKYCKLLESKRDLKMGIRGLVTKFSKNPLPSAFWEEYKNL